MPFSRLIDYFEAKAALCSTDSELHHLLADATLELGFDHFALLHHSSLLSAGSRLIRIDSYPAGWERALRADELVGHDPVHLACTRTNIGFAWRELPDLVDIGARGRDMLDGARRFGIADGFTVPVNIPGEPAGSCSFALRPGSGLPVERLLCAEQVGAHAFRAARRIHALAAAGAPPRLSRRERQCIRLVAAGKTDWEIATILEISVQTARQYVKRARSAYDVVSRAQLVACGLRDAVVSYEEAIPPAR